MCNQNLDYMWLSDNRVEVNRYFEINVEKTDKPEKGSVKISFFINKDFQNDITLSNEQRLQLIRFLGGVPLDGFMDKSAAVSAMLDDKEKVISPKQKTPITDNKIKPNHYKLTIPVTHKDERILAEVECGDVLKAIEQPFYPSNAMKYLWRAGKKDGESYFDDIRKAKQCLEEELKDRQFE